MNPITQWLWTHPQATWPILAALLAAYGFLLYLASPAAAEDEDDEEEE